MTGMAFKEEFASLCALRDSLRRHDANADRTQTKRKIYAGSGDDIHACIVKGLASFYGLPKGVWPYGFMARAGCVYRVGGSSDR